jgi:hypothetical protein
MMLSHPLMPHPSEYVHKKVVLEADIQNCFPTTPHQLVLDMVAGQSIL